MKKKDFIKGNFEVFCEGKKKRGGGLQYPSCTGMYMYIEIIKFSAYNSGFDWLKRKKVYLHPPNRKYVVSNANNNAVSTVNVKLIFDLRIECLILSVY